MGNFATMKKAEVDEDLKDASSISTVISKAKTKFGQLAHLDKCKTLMHEALNAAKDQDVKKRILEPYAKIGVVDGQLVFRVKHKKGHFGNADIVLVDDYEGANKDVKLKESKKDVMGVLDTAGKKPSLTAAWWRTARGKLAESHGLEKILVEYERDAAAVNSKQSRKAHNDVCATADKLRMCARNVCGAYKQYKNDEAILKVFLTQIENAIKFHEDKRQRYEAAVASTVQATKHNADHIFRLDDIDGKLKDVVSGISKPTKKSLSDADAQLLGIQAILAGFEKRAKDYKPAPPVKDWVDLKDVNADLGTSIQKIMQDGKRELAMRIKLRDQLAKQVEEKLNEVFSAPPDDPEYAKLIKRVIDIYEDVHKRLKGVGPEAKQRANAAKQVAAPSDASGVAGVLDTIERTLDEMDRTAKKARDIFQETRESSGEGPTLQGKLNDEDKIFPRKIFTATKQTNQALTGVMEEGVSHMEDVIQAILKLSNIDAHKQRIVKLEQRAKKWHDKANVF